MDQCPRHIRKWEIKALKDKQEQHWVCPCARLPKMNFLLVPKMCCVSTRCSLNSNARVRLPFAVCPCIVCVSLNPRVSLWLYFCHSETKSDTDQWGSMTSVNEPWDGCCDFLSTVKVRDTAIIWLRTHPTSAVSCITSGLRSGRMISATQKSIQVGRSDSMLFHSLPPNLPGYSVF